MESPNSSCDSTLTFSGSLSLAGGSDAAKVVGMSLSRPCRVVLVHPSRHQVQVQSSPANGPAAGNDGDMHGQGLWHTRHDTTDKCHPTDTTLQCTARPVIRLGLIVTIHGTLLLSMQTRFMNCDCIEINTYRAKL